jgi:hypothetical protein
MADKMTPPPKTTQIHAGGGRSSVTDLLWVNAFRLAGSLPSFAEVRNGFFVVGKSAKTSAFAN